MPSELNELPSLQAYLGNALLTEALEDIDAAERAAGGNGGAVIAIGSVLTRYHGVVVNGAAHNKTVSLEEAKTMLGQAFSARLARFFWVTGCRESRWQRTALSPARSDGARDHGLWQFATITLKTDHSEADGEVPLELWPVNTTITTPGQADWAGVIAYRKMRHALNEMGIPKGNEQSGPWRNAFEALIAAKVTGVVRGSEPGYVAARQLHLYLDASWAAGAAGGVKRLKTNASLASSAHFVAQGDDPANVLSFKRKGERIVPDKAGLLQVLKEMQDNAKME